MGIEEILSLWGFLNLEGIMLINKLNREKRNGKKR
jgi:hypothetical protein